jgi:transposase-like protein
MSQRKDRSDEEAGMEAREQTTEELPERWSARAKTEIVLRLFKGEELGTVSRETQVPVHELERWRRLFLEGGTNGFKRRDSPGAERELKRVQAKVGELTMKLEIVEWLLEKKGFGEELKKLKRSGEL